MSLNLAELAMILKDVNTQTVGYAAKAINRAVTFRSWIYGYYIQAYELNGSDRAEYGEKVMEKLSKILENHGVKAAFISYLRICLQFYNIYPSIGQIVADQLRKVMPALPSRIHQTLSGEFAAQDD
jgi:hypothetical protein